MSNRGFLADADVLIDYSEANLAIFSLVSEHISQVYVLQQVLDTVTGLSRSLCRRHRIIVLDAETDLVMAAGRKSGPLSFEDWLCYLICEQNQWVCVTNDRVLIRECERGGVGYRRGLRLMIDLVTAGQLTRGKAMRFARSIQKANPVRSKYSAVDDGLFPVTCVQG